MKLTLPQKLGSNALTSIDIQKIVVVGANGSGKTRFGSNIEENNLATTLRISAQKSLIMPKEISPKSLQKAESEFWYGSSNDDPRWLEQHGKRLGRWNSDFNTSFLNDFDRLLILLHTEEYELSLKYKEGEIPRPTTKLDRVQKIWEELLPHRTLIKRAGTIETHPYKKPELKYSSSQMSDGERVIFYLIGEVVCSRSNSLIIIDEPEMHLHKSICCKLWDLLENERKDCAFIYLTHDIDFAVSRVDSLKIWAKSYEGNNSWDYEIIDTISALPSDIFLEILGSRKPVLFIEGEKSSIDYFLYSSVFKDFTIKSIGSCEKVIDSTKTFNDLNGFHHIEAYGLIDRDTRTDEEITHIKDNKILIAEVSEVENLLLVEEIVKTIASYMGKDPNLTFEQVKTNVVRFFQSQIELQAVQHSIARIERIFKTATSHAGIKTFDDLNNNLNNFWSSQDFRKLYGDIIANFTVLVDNSNYSEILKVFNNKGIIHNSKVSDLCDLKQNNGYFNLIISILSLNTEESKTISEAIRKRIN